MSLYYNLNDLIDNTIRSGYGISFDMFGKQLRIIIYKEHNEKNQIKIQQIIPTKYLTDINKMTNLISFMTNKINKINDENLNEIN